MSELALKKTADSPPAATRHQPQFIQMDVLGSQMWLRVQCLSFAEYSGKILKKTPFFEKTLSRAVSTRKNPRALSMFSGRKLLWMICHSMCWWYCCGIVHVSRLFVGCVCDTQLKNQVEPAHLDL